MPTIQLGLQYSEQLDPIVRGEFEQLVAALQNALSEQSDLTNEVASAIQSGTLANIPTGLGVGDTGFRYRVTDYGHELTWSGSAWEFSPGDNGSGYYAFFQVAPQASGWVLCDGSVTDYLQVGATVTAVAFTTPNASGTPTYLKSGGASTTTPAITAPNGATFTTDEDHTHVNSASFGGDFSANNSGHFHSGTTNADMDVRHISAMLYFRR